jgi:hypothetical protein
MPPDPRRMHEDFRRHYDQQRANRDLSARGGSQSPHALLCRCPSCRSEADRLRDAERVVNDDDNDWSDYYADMAEIKAVRDGTWGENLGLVWDPLEEAYVLPNDPLFLRYRGPR